MVRAEVSRREKSLYGFFGLIMVSGAFVITIPLLTDLISKYKYLCCRRPRCRCSKEEDEENKVQTV